MNIIRQTVSVALVAAMLSLGLASAQAQRPYRMNDRQVESALRRVETDADRFRSSFSTALDRSRWNGTSTEDQLNGYVQNFETATDQLRSRFNARNAAASDMENVLRQAAFLNDFMMRNRLDMQAMNDWTTLRADLDALARVYNVTWDWTRQTGATYGNDGYGNTGPVRPQTGAAYRISDRQLDAIIRRVETGADRFRTSMSNSLDRSRYDGTRAEDNINQFIGDFETATDTLRSRFDGRTSVASDVENVLRQATYIDDFMNRQTLSARAENDWTTLRGDLGQLASAYSVAWNWDVRSLPGYGNTTADSNVFGDQRRGGGGMRGANRLTGTFRLDTTQSDNSTTVAETAVRNLPYNERARVREQLMRRLESPSMLAIERNGNSVTIASSRAPQTTFTANAGESREQMSRVSSTLNGDRLIVRSTGNRETDFTVTFDPIEGGRRLRVTREIWNDRLGANPLVVQNVYERTSDVAEWNVYNGTDAGYSQSGTISTAAGDFAVPDGQMLTARLESDLSTRTAKTGDRFTLTVTSPAQFQGAVIEGHVASSSRSGRATGRSDISLNFDTIRYNGRSYQFAGFIESARGMNGETVQVDNEGTVREDDSRGTQTAQRAAIGTAVGAIIGAIAGGGKGAAIGAIVGAGAGAGSVYVQGRDDLELLSGSEVTIRASSPNR